MSTTISYLIQARKGDDAGDSLLSAFHFIKRLTTQSHFVQQGRDTITILSVNVRNISQHSLNSFDANCVCPSEWPARVIYALLHCSVEIRNATHALVHDVCSFIHQHRHSTHNCQCG